MKHKQRGGWTVDMKGPTEQGRQVLCLTSDAGWVWMSDFDRLPNVVRRRLAASHHNICPACMAIQAWGRTPGRETVSDYIKTIERIERELDRTAGG